MVDFCFIACTFCWKKNALVWQANGCQSTGCTGQAVENLGHLFSSIHITNKCLKVVYNVVTIIQKVYQFDNLALCFVNLVAGQMFQLELVRD